LRKAKNCSFGYRTPEEFARKAGGEKAVKSTLHGKVQPTFPLRLEIPQNLGAGQFADEHSGRKDQTSAPSKSTKERPPKKSETL
jgi:hypothetical protein